MNQTDLSVKIGSLELRNPVMTASGTFGYGDEFYPLVDPGRLGAVVVKSLSLNPRIGNPPPRVVETPSGMLNAIGLANMGLERFLNEKLPLLEKMNAVVIVNINGHTEEEYGEVTAGLKGVDAVSGIECGGMAFGTDPEVTARVTERVLKNSDKPVIVKLSPNVTDIRSVARAAESAGADGLSLINTLAGMAIDIEKRVPKLANISGGLSGPAIRPVAVYKVYQVVHAVQIPVIGMGGIMDYKDALEFLIAGARAVQVGTANFVHPTTALDIIEGLRRFCEEHGVMRIEDLIGTLKID
jgi:dihydroorotate dehydrogenase (NAD+) catalytic subunit